MGGSKHGELPASFARSTSAAVAGVTVPTSVTCTPTMDPLAAQPSPERCQPAGFHRPPRPESVASAAAGNCPGGEKNPAGHGRRPRPGTGPCGRPAPEEAGKAGPAGEDRRRGHRGSVAPTAARRGLPPLPVPLKLENTRRHQTAQAGRRLNRSPGGRRPPGAGRRARGGRHAGPQPGPDGSHPSLQYRLTSRDDGVKPCTEAMYRSTSALLRLIAPPAWTPGRDRPARRPSSHRFHSPSA